VAAAGGKSYRDVVFAPGFDSLRSALEEGAVSSLLAYHYPVCN
jgi:hypothetical protein